MTQSSKWEKSGNRRIEILPGSTSGWRTLGKEGGFAEGKGDESRQGAKRRGFREKGSRYNEALRLAQKIKGKEPRKKKGIFSVSGEGASPEKQGLNLYLVAASKESQGKKERERGKIVA